MSNRVRSLDWPRRPALIVIGLLAFAFECSAADTRRWRVFEQDQGALLAVSHSDEATDDLGSLSFRCKAKSGTIAVTGDADQELRNAVADLLRSNDYPQVQLVPPTTLAPLLSVSYSEAGSVWEYSFELQADEPGFDAFKRTGRLTFKVGKTVVHDEFKTGLESIAKFQSICTRPK